MPKLSKTASAGNRLETLQSLRDLLAREIESCESSRDLAALVTRLQSVLSEIETLAPAEQKGDVVDEIAKRRAARRAGAATG